MPSLKQDVILQIVGNLKALSGRKWGSHAAGCRRPGTVLLKSRNFVGREDSNNASGNARSTRR